MSAISSSTGVGSSLAQFFQQLQANSSNAAAGVTAPLQTAATDPTVSDPSVSTSQAPTQGAHRHHGHGGGLFKKIEAAVTSALQSAQSSGSGGTSSSSDPNSIIESAIAKVFQQLQGGGTSGASGATPAADADGDTDGDTAAAVSEQSEGAGATSGTGGSGRQQFATFLQSFGVSESQFRADFKAAIEQAQGGQVNQATAFQSFPPGTLVDTTA